MELKKLDTAKIFCFNKCFKHYEMSKKDYGMRMIESLEEVHYGPQTRTGIGIFSQDFPTGLVVTYGRIKKTGYGRILSFYNITR